MRRLLLALWVLPVLGLASSGTPVTGEFELTSTLTEVLGGPAAQRLASIYPP